MTVKAESFATNPLVLLRSAMADRWFSKIRRAVFETIGTHVVEAAERVEEGSGQPVTDSMSQRWVEDLIEAQRPYMYGMTLAGYELAADEFAEKRLANVPTVMKQEVGGVDDEFLQLPRPQDVDTYLEETSKLETATTRKKIDATFQKALAFYDEDLKRGMTPREIARLIESEGIATTKARSELIARTTTIWAYNEGAQQQYAELGIRSERWLVTEDDVLCDFCRAMDGVVVPIDEAFWSAGSSMEIAFDNGRRGLDFPFDIQHPPLHPYCRCAVVPNI